MARTKDFDEFDYIDFVAQFLLGFSIVFDSFFLDK